jgi:polyferredoxin
MSLAITLQRNIKKRLTLFTTTDAYSYEVLASTRNKVQTRPNFKRQGWRVTFILSYIFNSFCAGAGIPFIISAPRALIMYFLPLLVSGIVLTLDTCHAACKVRLNELNSDDYGEHDFF